ncbi:putative serine dehydratase domain-containing protein [Whalleya microplaca]|nr:putative serine dehydratase domain-containing protein [Whalleya microplaca]
MAVQLSKDLLRAQFVGKSLHQVPTPAVVLDLAKIEANCNLMLEAADRLQLSWRAHIKTHKTEELTRLQVGDKGPVNLIVSTVIEAESLLPLLKEYQAKGRAVNVLYSFPLYGSCVDRLAQFSAQLGPGALTVMVDHEDQVKHLTALASKSGHPPLVFLKIDMGSHRAGVIPATPECNALISALLLSETVGSSILLGLYTHAGHSYASRRDWEAMGILSAEFSALQQVATIVRRERPSHPLVLSVGATPTATTIQHPDLSSSPLPKSPAPEADLLSCVPTAELSGLIAALRSSGFTLEVHAGVYPTLDIQQLAAHARDASTLNSGMIGISVLAEVASLYPSRNAAPEALVNAGCLALGREPCIDAGEEPGRDYAAWGIVSPWNTGSGSGEEGGKEMPVPGPGFPAVHGGWQVGRISQEHGVLQWVGKKEDEVPLHVGQRVRIWPNHSCITGAGHAWYLVVDSRREGAEDEIVDVWPRWNGW